MRRIAYSHWIAKLAVASLCLQLIATLGHHHDHAAEQLLATTEYAHAHNHDHDAVLHKASDQEERDHHPKDDEKLCAPCLSLAISYCSCLPGPASVDGPAVFDAIAYGPTTDNVFECKLWSQFHARGPPALRT
jgi:hypothetical protein